MKLLFKSEDCVFGLLVGYILIGMSGLWWKLPAWPSWVWGIVLGASAIFTLFDINHTIHELSGHAGLIFLNILNNVTDFLIEIGMLGIIFGFSIPLISGLINPYLINPSWLAGIGIFFIVSSIAWFISDVVNA